MKDSNLYIMITGDKNKTSSFVLSTASLKTGSIIAALFLGSLLLVSAVGIYFSLENITLKTNLNQVSLDLQEARAWNQEFEQEVTAKMAEKEMHLQNTLNVLQESSHKKEQLLSNALGELESRSKTIESILTTVGIEATLPEGGEDRGGPFVPLSDTSLEDLTFKVDHYLETIKSIPLGTPVLGAITSKYGRRIDPINKKPGFHAGLDIRQSTGTSIFAPAGGKVIEQGYTKGHGNYLVIDHGGNFKSRYFHMQKSLAKKGQEVKRGQVIGLVGNTGRSTGPHLHYEILFKNRSVNPLKYVRFARKLHKSG